DVPRSVAVVREAATRAGRDPRSIEITARLLINVDPTGSAADQAVRRHVTTYLNVPVYRAFHEWLRRGAAPGPMGGGGGGARRRAGGRPGRGDRGSDHRGLDEGDPRPRAPLSRRRRGPRLSLPLDARDGSRPPARNPRGRHARPRPRRLTPPTPRTRSRQ